MIARALSWRARPLLLTCDSTVPNSSLSQTASIGISESCSVLHGLAEPMPSLTFSTSPFLWLSL